MLISTAGIYALMGFIALVISYRAFSSYKKTEDTSLFYFTAAFSLFALYLLILAFLSYLLDTHTISKLFDIGYAIARFFVVLGILFLFQTAVFQSSIFFSRYRVFISTCILLLGAIALYIQTTNFQEVFVSKSGIIIQPVETIPAVIAAFLTYGISVSWTYITTRNLPNSSSYTFRIKTYLIGIGGILLATGDTMYVFAKHLPDTFIGPFVNLAGYLLVIFALLLPAIRHKL